MNRIKVFLILAFIAACVLCVSALLIAGSPAALLLYRIGAVIAVACALLAMADRVHAYLLSNGDKK